MGGGLILLTALLLFVFLWPTNQTATMEGGTVAVDVQNVEVATFAAGCFWCTEAVFQETNGVLEVISGYAGGVEVNPSYEQVYTNQTSHREAVQIAFDATQITYEEVLDILWQNIDPTDDGGQFVDRGLSYTTAIFYHNDKQRDQAESSRENLALSGRISQDIKTPIVPFTTFYKAEEYHQDFYKKSVDRYNQYEMYSGREEFKAAVWQTIQMESTP